MSESDENRLTAALARLDGVFGRLAAGVQVLSLLARNMALLDRLAGVLGRAGININGMQVGASADKGTNVMAVAVDKDIPTAVLPALMNIDGIHDVKVIHCEH